MDNDTLPGCLGYYGKPLAPNGPCEKCRYAKVCKHVIHKKRLEAILSKIAEIKEVLRG